MLAQYYTLKLYICAATSTILQLLSDQPIDLWKIVQVVDFSLFEHGMVIPFTHHESAAVDD